MATDHIRYDILAQEALRGVVRSVITDAAKNGLPGDHHFFISFDTQAEGVELSPRMRAQYPQEMTVVLQHQFWDLAVDEDGFEVGLSFGGIPERIAIPFAAITKFVDPTVQFGLQFAHADEAQAEPGSPERGAQSKGESKGESKGGSGPASRPPAEHKGPRPAPAVVELSTPANSPPDPDKPGAGGGEVVRLDRFRKK